MQEMYKERIMLLECYCPEMGDQRETKDYWEKVLNSRDVLLADDIVLTLEDAERHMDYLKNDGI